MLDFARAWGLRGMPGRIFHTPDLPSRSFQSMGTLATVTLGADYADLIEPITKHIREIFDRLESEMSAYRSDSAVRELSRMAGAASVAFSEDAYRVLQLSQHFGELTSGAFDPTASPLAKLWGFNGAPVPVTQPSGQSISEVLKLVDYRRMILREGTAFLPLQGMAVDVGGIAKGYAVDRAYDSCVSAGIHDFLIDFSGNVRAAGRPSQRERWQIGVRDPFDGDGVLGKIALPGGLALATSGSYERFVDIAGQRFSHVINPRTGYPVTGTASITVLAPDAVTADALSTAFFVTGLKEARDILEKAHSVELLLALDRYPMDLWFTPGLEAVFKPGPRLG